MNHLARPFAALRPRQETAQAVVAPPYDVVDPDEVRTIVADRPSSFLRVSRPEVDLPPGTDPYTDAVYARGRMNFDELLRRGVLERETSDCYYVYRMRDGAHTQTGIAFAASIEAYESGRIHPHESTRPDKETDRVRNIESLDAQTGPVMLAYKAADRIQALLREGASGTPLLAVEDPQSVAHTIWRIASAPAIEALTDAIDELGDLYIADGHHRAAAAARVARNRAEKGTSGDRHPGFLSVAFPDDEMRILDYNRVVADLNGLSPGEFLTAVAAHFEVEKIGTEMRPDGPRRYAMYLAGSWYRLSAPGPDDSDADPVAALDVSVLQNRLLAPILGIGDPRTDARIGFVGGARGLTELARRVDGGRAAVAFALYPTGIRELMAVADAGLLMPPKSTWFEPKLADGLLTHVLHD